MEIRTLSEDKKNNKLSFMLKDSTPVFANTLRRLMIDEVPTMAIEDVEIRNNSSILYDEMVAHRLGLIPIKTDLKSYNLIQECTCEGEGCAKCSLKLTLKFPKAKSITIVNASELKSQDPKVVPALPDLPIVKLMKGQEIELEATAVLGKGKEHMKWSPGLVHYRYKPVVDISGKCDNCGDCAKKCPKDILNMDKDKISINKDNLINCDLCGACAECCPKGAIALNENASDFIFNIESWGQLKPKDIVLQAIDIFNSKADEFIEKIKK